MSFYLMLVWQRGNYYYSVPPNFNQWSDQLQILLGAIVCAYVDYAILFLNDSHRVKICLFASHLFHAIDGVPAGYSCR